MPMPGKGSSSRNFGPSPIEGGSMLNQAVSRRRLLPAGSLLSRQRDVPILEPLCAANSVIAFISHDLRHPLTAIRTNAEFLSRSDISEMERSDYYQEIRWAIDRMNEMVSSLLECSKGRDTLRPAVRNIVDTVERAIRMTSVRPKLYSRSQFPLPFGREQLNEHDCGLGRIRSDRSGKRRPGSCSRQQEWGCCRLRATRIEDKANRDSRSGLQKKW